MERVDLKCHNCGGELEPIGSSLYKCRSCGGEQYVLSDEVNILCAGAFENLRRGEFDEAEEKLTDVIAMHPDNAEAHWGRALARHGIVFVDDAMGRRRVPTYAGLADSDFTADPDFKRALALARGGVAESYATLGGEIEKVRREWRERAKKEPPYDIFICYKESDASGFRTPDSYEAQSLYTHFVQAGYNVFFARESLRGKVGEQYEPYIYNALRTAKIMIIYGQSSENFKSVWVRNEWTRFLGLVERGLKHTSALVVAYERMQPSDLPQRLRSLQCMDASRKTFLQDLDAHVKRVTESATPLDGTVERINVGEERVAARGSQTITLKKIGAGGSATVVMDGARKESVICKMLASGMFDKAAAFASEELKLTPNAGRMKYYKLLCDCRVANDYEFATMKSFSRADTVDEIINATDKKFAEKLLVNCYLLASNLMTTSPREGAALAAVIFPYDFSERGKCVRKLMKAVAGVRSSTAFSAVVAALSDENYAADTLTELGDVCLAVGNFRYALECFTVSSKRFGRADSYRGIIRAKNEQTLSARKVEYEAGDKLLGSTADFENVLRSLSGRHFALEVRSALDSIIADTADPARMVKAFNHFVKYYPNELSEIDDLFRLVSDRCLREGRFKDVIYYRRVLLGMNDKDPSNYWAIILAKTGSRNTEELLASGIHIDKLEEYDKFLAVASESDVDKCISISRRQREGKKRGKAKVSKSESVRAETVERVPPKKTKKSVAHPVDTSAKKLTVVLVVSYVLAISAFISASLLMIFSFGRDASQPLFAIPASLSAVMVFVVAFSLNKYGFTSKWLPLMFISALDAIMLGLLAGEYFLLI